MSHFTVMVVGEVEKQLQPFHEFECTGTDDQYVVDVDDTEEYRKEYEEKILKLVRLADGKVVGEYDETMFRLPNEEEQAILTKGGLFHTPRDMGVVRATWSDGKYGARIKYTPEGAEHFEKPAKEHISFYEYVTSKDYGGIPAVPVHGIGPNLIGDHKYHYALVDDDLNVVKVVRRTNPSKQWDYWTIGGRWTNFLLTKSGERVDAAMKKEIDVEGIRDEKRAEAEKHYDTVAHIVDHIEIEPWSAFHDRVKTEELGIEEARNQYHAQPGLMELKTWATRNKFSQYMWDVEELFLMTREQFVQSWVDGAFSTFAVLKDGIWSERGSMGWWGSVSDEKDDWSQRFAELFDSVGDDEMITIVDCHI